MFGYVTIAAGALTQEQRERYRAYYCGLCHALKHRYGALGRMTLSYDITFLYLLLSSLYEPDEIRGTARCLPHPFRPHAYVQSELCDYCCDMNLALAYHKCLDDWHDDRSLPGRAEAALLAEAYGRVAAAYPKPCGEIERSLAAISVLEHEGEPSPDAAANLTASMLGAIYRYREDLWADTLQRIGEGLGRFIYLMDAYDDLEADLMRRIEGLQNQLEHVTDKRNTIIRANRAAKTAMEVFDDIINKPHLEKQDLELIIDRIFVYEDHVEIRLKADIDTLLRKGEYPVEDEGSGGMEPVSVVQSATHHADKVLRANIVSDGDPLEIFTDKDGEVIFKKYSPIGELSDFATQICDSLHRSTDALAAVCDRDSVIAVAGGGKRELLSKRVSPELEQLMEARRVYRHQNGTPELPITENDGPYSVAVAAPVVSEGDLMGCIIFAQPKNSPPASEVEYKLAETVAGFLGRQMEA